MLAVEVQVYVPPSEVYMLTQVYVPLSILCSPKSTVPQVYVPLSPPPVYNLQGLWIIDDYDQYPNPNLVHHFNWSSGTCLNG